MSQTRDEVHDMDRIDTILEQLIGFIMSEILNSRSEFNHDGHINSLFISML